MLQLFLSLLGLVHHCEGGRSKREGCTDEDSIEDMLCSRPGGPLDPGGKEGRDMRNQHGCRKLSRIGAMTAADDIDANPNAVQRRPACP